MSLSMPWMLLVLLPATLVLGLIWRRALRRRATARIHALLRSAIAMLLALAAAGLLLAGGGRPRSMVIIDRSASMGAVRMQAAGAGRICARILSGDSEPAFASFADNVREESAGSADALMPDPAGTDLGVVLRHVRSGLERGERAVLISDFRDSSGGWRREALAWDNDAPQLVLLPAGNDGPDLAVLELNVPETVRPGERVAVVATIGGRCSTSAEVTLTRSDPADRDTVVARRSLPPAGVPGNSGRRILRFEDTAPESGRLKYRLDIALAGDVEPGNNSMHAFVRVLAPLRCALLSPAGEAGIGRVLTRARTGLQEIAPGGDLAAALPGVDTLFIEGLPRASLPEAACRQIVEYVRSGGGLVMLGGDYGYAAGGYHDGGSLEKILPVSMVPPDGRGLLVVLLLDRSGSMGAGGAGSGSKLQEVCKAARDLIDPDCFGPRDRIAVIAFSESPETLAQPVPLHDPGAVSGLKRAIGALEAGGGTDLAGALEAALKLTALKAYAESPRHIILLSDGLPVGESGVAGQKKRLLGLSLKIAESGATLSTVGTGGGDEDAELLARLAARGKGRYYRPSDMSALAGIFRRDISSSRGEIAGGEFTPLRTGWSMAGLPDPLPVLRKRNRFSARSNARVALEAPPGEGRGREPLLAVWNAGRGRVACLGTGFSSGWSDRVAGQRPAAQLMEALALWSAGRGGRDGCYLVIGGRTGRGQGRGAYIDLLARDTNGLALEGIAPVISINGADPVEMLQTGPSRWRADLQPADSESDIRAVVQSRGEELASAFFAVSYPPEIARTGIDRATLKELAELTSARIIASPARLMSEDAGGTARRGWRDCGFWLGLAALMMVFFELGLRAARR